MSLRLTYNPTGNDKPTTRKGFWGRLWGKLKTTFSKIPTINAILQIAEDILGVDLVDGKISSIDIDGLTDTDQAKVSNWDLSVFTPFFEQLLLETKDIFDISDLKTQIASANIILNKICAVKSHYSKNTLGFSYNAQIVVVGYIEDTLMPVEKYINAQFDKDIRFIKQQTFTPIESLNLGSVIAGNQMKSVSCNLYVNKSTDSNPVVAEEIVVTTSNTGQPLVETTGVEVSTASTSKSNYILPAIVLGFIALAVLLGKKSKKNN